MKLGIEDRRHATDGVEAEAGQMPLPQRSDSLPNGHYSMMRLLRHNVLCIDHVAIAVRDLEGALPFFVEVMGFEMVERRETKGRRTAMDSAVLRLGEVVCVLMQGRSPESQITRFIEHYGPGVQHLALRVRDASSAVSHLKRHGIDFSTTVIQGTGLTQSFTRRDGNTGMMWELIERSGEPGFQSGNVDELFRQLEASNDF